MRPSVAQVLHPRVVSRRVVDVQQRRQQADRPPGGADDTARRARSLSCSVCDGGVLGKAKNGRDYQFAHESGGNIARQAFRTVSAGDLGDRRSCPTLVQELSNLASGPSFGPKSANIGRMWANFGPMSTTAWQTPTNICRLMPNIGRVGPNLAIISLSSGPVSAEVAQQLAYLGPKLNHVRPNSADSGLSCQTLINSGRLRANSANTWPYPTANRLIWAEVGSNLSSRGFVSTTLGQPFDNFGGTAAVAAIAGGNFWERVASKSPLLSRSVILHATFGHRGTHDR